MRSSDFAIQRTCAAPIPGFSGARLNLTSETLWIICALPRKVSSGSPTFMPMYSQRSIAARSELGEGHRSPLGIEFYNTIPRKFPSDLRVDEYTPWVGGRIRCGSMNVAPRPPGQSAFAPENLRASRGVLQVHPQRQQASRVARATAYQVRVRDQSEKAIQVE